MLKCLKYEVFKLLHRKALICLVIVCLLAFVALLFFQVKGTDTCNAEKYKETYNAIESLDFSEALNYLDEQSNKIEAFLLLEEYEWEMLNYGPSEITEQLNKQIAEAKKQYGDSMEERHNYNDLREELSAIEIVRSEVISNTQYYDYLKNIQVTADRLNSVSIFENQTGFSANNINKTAHDMAKMQDVTIRIGAQKGVLLFTGNSASDVLILLTILVLVYFIFFDEKENSLFAITKTTPLGTTKTYYAKLAVLLINVIVLWCVLFIINGVFAVSYYGLGDVQRSIQSIGAFYESDIQTSVLGMLCIMFVARVIGSFALGLIIMLLTTKTKNMVSFAGITLLLFGIGYLFTGISAQSVFFPLKYINLYTVFNPQTVLMQYTNLNFIGFPINTKPLMILWGIFMLCVPILLGNIMYKRDFNSSQAIRFVRLFKQRFSKKHTSLIGLEFHKMRIYNKTTALLLAYVLLQVILINSSSFYIGPEEHYYSNYMSILQGEINDEKIDFIKKEKQQLDLLAAQNTLLNEKYANGEISYAELQKALNQNTLSPYRQNAFQRVYSQYEYIVENSNAHFLYDTGYKILLGIDEQQQDYWYIGALMLCIMLSLCMSNIFALEHSSGMIVLLRTTKNGGKATVKAKIIASCILTTIVFLITYLPQLFVILKCYGSKNITAPLNSIPMFAEAGVCSVLGGILLSFFVRYIVSLSVAFVVLGISKWVRKNIYVLALSLFLFAFPLLMHKTGIDIFDYASLYRPLVMNNMVTVQELLHLLILCSGYIGIAIVSCFSLKKLHN